MIADIWPWRVNGCSVGRLRTIAGCILERGGIDPLNPAFTRETAALIYWGLCQAGRTQNGRRVVTLTQRGYRAYKQSLRPSHRRLSIQHHEKRAKACVL